MRRALALFLGLLMLLTTLPAAAFAEIGGVSGEQTPVQLGAPAVGELVPIDAAHFGDAAFCAYLADTWDSSGDGALSLDERAAVTGIYCVNRGITAITGLGCFENLTTLKCSENPLVSLDVSGCALLSELRCCCASLTSLDVSGCPSLTFLDCSNNALTSLDVRGNSQLQQFFCSSTALTALDVSSNTSLQFLSCERSAITALDLRANTALTGVYCQDNLLTALTMGEHTALTTLECQGNELTTLDVSGCPLLDALYCYNNRLASLNVSGCAALCDLGCDGNELTTLDVSDCVDLKVLDCQYNCLTALDVSGNDAMWWLHCDHNALQSLTLGSGVKMLDCSNNPLGTLDVSVCGNMETLYVSNASLAALDVSHCPNLQELACNDNQLTALNIASNPRLLSLECCRNRLTALDTTLMAPAMQADWVYPCVYYDGNPLTSVAMGADVQACHLGASALPSAEQIWMNEYVADYICAPTTTVTAANSATVTDYHADGSKTEWLCYQPDPQIEVHFNSSGAKRFKTEIFIGMFSQLRAAGLECVACAVSDQSAAQPWQAGQTYTCEVRMGDRVDTVCVTVIASLTGGTVPLDEAHFEDGNFRSYLTDFDTDGDGALSQTERSAVLAMDCSGRNTASLRGVAYFGNLMTLICSRNELTALDVSSCTSLRTLDVSDNDLTTLEVGGCTRLASLFCGGNELTALDVSKCTALHELECYDNLLTSLDTTAMASVEDGEGGMAAPQVFYDGNPLASVSMGAAVRVCHLGVDAPPSCKRGDSARYIMGWSSYGEYTAVTEYATVTDYHADGSKTEWRCCRPDPMLTVQFNEQGTKHFGCESITDTLSHLQAQGLGDLFVTSRQSAEDAWTAGSTYLCAFHLGEMSAWTLCARVLGESDPVQAIEVVEDVALTQYSGGDWACSYAWDEAAQRSAPDGIYYRYAMDPLVKLTLSSAAAEQYNDGLRDCVCRLSEVSEKLSLSDYPYACLVGETTISSCGTYDGFVQLGGLTARFRAEIAAGPVAELAVSPQPVEMMAGTHGEMVAEQDFDGGSYEYFRYETLPETMVYTATFTDAGAESYNVGIKTFTGTAEALTDLLGEAPQFGSLQVWDVNWHEGGTYEAVVSVPGVKCPVDVRITEGPVESIVAETEEPLALVENYDGWWNECEPGQSYFQYATNAWDCVRDENGQDSLCFIDSRAISQRCYTVTFTEAGAAMYGCGGVSGTLEDIYRVTGAVGIYTGGQTNHETWALGSRHTLTLHLLGSTCEVPVTVTASPVASVAPAFEVPVMLVKNDDGHWETNPDGQPVFYYSLSWGDGEYTVTFTDEGAAQYGCAAFTGTMEKIDEFFGGDIAYFSSEQTYWDYDNQCTVYTPWLAGETHTLTLHLMGKTCQVPVEIVDSPIKSIAPVMSRPLTLVENCDGWWQMDERGHEYFRYDTNMWCSQLPYAVVFTDEGAARYGRRSFVGTLGELSELTGKCGWFDGEQVYWDESAQDTACIPWEAGETYTLTLHLLGKTCSVYVSVVDTALKELALADGGRLTMQRGIDGFWWFDSDAPSSEGHFYYDVFERRYWDEEEQDWLTASCWVTATFTDAGMARYGEERSGEYALSDLLLLQNGNQAQNCSCPGENWENGDQTVSLMVLGKQLDIPVTIEEPRVELTDLSVSMAEPLVAGGDANSYLWSKLNYELTYREAGSTATQSDVMTGLEIFDRWGTQPFVYANKPDDEPWVAGQSYELSVGLMNRTATVTAVAQEDTSLVALTEENFPDAGLRECLSCMLDSDRDGFVSADSVLSLECYGPEIGSLQGIERFTKLKNLVCMDCAVTSLDLRPLRELAWLEIQNCAALAELDVSGSTALTHMRVYDCAALTSLNVSGCTALRSLSVYACGLTSLDVSDDTALVRVCCDNGVLAALDVSGCTALQYLYCCENQLSELDVTKNTALVTLECSHNRLTALDVTKNTRLIELYCAENSLGQLDVTKNTALETLVCGGNCLMALDVTKNTALTALGCDSNCLTSLNVASNTSLELLDCYHNALTALDVTKNTALTYLHCGDMDGLTELDVSASEGLTELDVSHCPSLSHIYLHHWAGLRLDTFGAAAGLQVTVGGKMLAKKPIIASNSSLGDGTKPVELHIQSKSGSDVFDAITDNGGAVFGNLAGQYTVTVSKDGYVSRTFDVNIGLDTEGVNVKIVPRGDLNGIAGVDPTGRVDENDCQRIYEVLNGEKPLETDENVSADDLAYARQVADTNGDGQLNILDFQCLYEDVVARREQGQ